MKKPNKHYAYYGTCYCDRTLIYDVNFVPYNPRTKEKKRVITYSKKNDIIALKKHVDANHVVLAKRFEEEVNFPLRNVFEKKNLQKKAKCV
jgi:hypothetical protein